MEAVPAFKTDLRVGVASHRDDRQASDLGESDDAQLDDITRALWTIGRHRQVVSPFCVAGEFEQSLGTATAAGAADLFYSESAQHGGQEGSILASADEGSEFAGMAPMDNH